MTKTGIIIYQSITLIVASLFWMEDAAKMKELENKLDTSVLTEYAYRSDLHQARIELESCQKELEECKTHTVND